GWRKPEEMLATPAAAAPKGWRLAALLGNFRGFDGHFDKPPLLLASGDQRQRHRFWVRSGAAQYRIDADVFGWVCRPDSSVDFPIRPGKKKPAALPVTATSWVEPDNLLAFTLPDSFRVRVLTPSGRLP